MSKRGNLHWMGHILAFLVLLSLTAFAASVVFGTWFPQTTVAMGALIAFFVCAPIGAFWMLYDCSRREKPPFIYFLLAFIPYAFVWYYFDRVRPRSARSTQID
jgi:hypothetical protein